MYEVKTPALTKAIALAEMAGSAVRQGQMEPKIANSMIGAARSITAAVRTDVYVRLNAPKIAFLEAQSVASGEVTGEGRQALEDKKGAAEQV